jgi:hypothetical protein
MVVRFRQNVVDPVFTHFVMIRIVYETCFNGVFREHCTLYKIRIRFVTGGAFQFNALVLDFECTNHFVEKGDNAQFSLNIIDNHGNPRGITLVICVNIELEQFVFVLFIVEKIQNGENTGAKEFGEKVEQQIELVLKQIATQPFTQTFTNGL